MNHKEAAQTIGEFFNFDADEFYGYMTEDTIGGWHTSEEHATWPCGSIWGIEGQIIYALVRMLKPEVLLEIGNFRGCSTTHLAAALHENKGGHLTSFDLYPLAKVPPKYKSRVTLFTHDLYKYDYDVTPKIDFLFQDDYHSLYSTEYVWRNFMEHAAPGGVIVAHDSEHEEAGPVVRAGIETVVDASDYLSILVEPSQCGLAMGRKP